MHKLIVGQNDLKSTFPSLIKEWDYKKNGLLLPEMVTYGSKKKVWWKCKKCGYSWEAEIQNRTKAKPTGCPYCANRIREKLPNKLTKEWHPTLNGSLLPTDVSPSSSKRVWWKCDKGHEWKMTVVARYKGSNCPYCDGKYLSTGNPELAQEWHPTNNGVLSPNDVRISSKQKVWWLGKCGHEWQAAIGDRSIKKAGCPYCSGNKVLIGFNDLSTVNPLLASEWHPIKNGDKTPEMFTSSSTHMAWWKGECGHEWRATIASRNSGIGCPECTKRQRTSFPEQALYYYLKQVFPNTINSYKDIFANRMELDVFIPTKNVAIEYDGVYWHGNDSSLRKEAEKYEICKKNSIRLIRVREDDNTGNSTNCDIAIGIRKSPAFSQIDDMIHDVLRIIEIDQNSIDIDSERDKNVIQKGYISTLKEQSLLNTFPDIAKEWNIMRNDSLTPDMFKPHSTEIVWWICDKGHEWKASISQRSSGNNCPYCSGKKVLQGFNDLETVEPDLALEWHPTKNDLSPKDVTKGSGKKVWWLGKCGHEWEARVSDRAIKESKCPYCQRKKLLVGFNDLSTVNPLLASEWHPLNNEHLLPSEVMPTSKKRVWWLGKCGHEWEATISDRNNGNGCPFCSGHRVLKGFNDLLSQKPSDAEDWDYEKNKEIEPFSIAAKSGRKVWWKCKKCGFEWETSPHDKKACPNCNSCKTL